MVKEIFQWEIVGDRRFATPHYLVYYMGQHDDHIMDWAGCNHRRVKKPDQPVFTSLKEAAVWAERNYAYKMTLPGVGRHVPEFNDQFGERVILSDSGGDAMDYLIGKDGELDEEAWDEYLEGF